MNTFELQMSNIVNQTIARQNQIVRYVVTGIDEAVVNKSPVDTGRFKANWQLGLDHAPTGTTESVDLDGASTIAANVGNIPAQAAGHVYYIVNNLDYAQALEDGHSRQSPPGNMVAATVAQYQSFVDEAVRNERT